MIDPRRLVWQDSLILTRNMPVAGERTQFYERARKGEFVAIRRGVYMRVAEWNALDPDAQHRARVYAAIEYDKRDPVVSHVSASAMWQLPWFSGYPRQVHVLGEIAVGGRSSSAMSRHTVGLPSGIVWIDGIRVTSLARTVTDIARTASFEQAVTVADAALRRTDHPFVGVPGTTLDRDELFAEIESLPAAQGTARARKVIEFADGLADLPGESISRVNIARAGFPVPELQAALRGASGRIWHVDFWWPGCNLIGEFDGRAKYLDEQYLRGRTANEVLYEEKLREDDLRAAGYRFTRWPWSTAIDMTKLRSHLIGAGLR